MFIMTSILNQQKAPTQIFSRDIMKEAQQLYYEAKDLKLEFYQFPEFISQNIHRFKLYKSNPLEFDQNHPLYGKEYLLNQIKNKKKQKVPKLFNGEFKNIKNKLNPIDEPNIPKTKEYDTNNKNNQSFHHSIDDELAHATSIADNKSTLIQSHRVKNRDKKP